MSIFFYATLSIFYILSFFIKNAQMATLSQKDLFYELPCVKNKDDKWHYY